MDLMPVLIGIRYDMGIFGIPSFSLWHITWKIRNCDSVESENNWRFNVCRQSTVRDSCDRGGSRKIDSQAFPGCKELKEVSIPASVTEIGEKVFDKTNDSLVLTVQPGSYAENYAKGNGIAYVNP